MSMSVDINPATQTLMASRSLRESGSSMVLTIPPEMVQSLDWQPGDKIGLLADWGDGEITLSKR